MSTPKSEGEAPTVTVVQSPTGWTVLEDDRVVSRHRRREPAHKAALDWAGREFENGRRLVVLLP
jgi:hypothetical protein